MADFNANTLYVQAATRLSIIPTGGFGAGALQPWEIVYRHGRKNMPGTASDVSQHSAGVNYYINPSTVWRIGYDVNVERGAGVSNNTLTLMLAMGF